VVALIESNFGPVSENWKELLSSAYVDKQLFYNGDELFGIVMIHDDNGTKIVNSATIRNEDFTFAMKLYIMRNVKEHGKFVIQSSKKDSAIARYCDGYDDVTQCFYKGV
jgi:hypothetical protein